MRGISRGIRSRDRNRVARVKHEAMCNVQRLLEKRGGWRSELQLHEARMSGGLRFKVHLGGGERKEEGASWHLGLRRRSSRMQGRRG